MAVAVAQPTAGAGGSAKDYVYHTAVVILPEAGCWCERPC